MLLAFFSVGALLEQPKDRPGFDPALWFGGLCIALLIGLRFNVGADWTPYADMFEYAGRISLARATTLNDPAYFILNWLVHQLGGELWLVNTICGCIFSCGLISFAQAQERPWLTALVGIPYLTIVVAMGYSRQSVAIGIILIGMTRYLKDLSIIRLAILFIIASLFHKTALIAFPLICLGSSRTAFVSALVVSTLTYGLYTLFLSKSVALLVTNYIDYAYSSQGAAIRVAMNIVPATLFFINKANFGFSGVEGRVWRNFSVAAFALLALLFILPSSTAVDRLALYVMPLQLAVLPRAWKGLLTDRLGVAAVLLYCVLVQFSWLNFAVHARFWVPYRLWPFE